MEPFEITVVIPTYNRADLISTAIESALGQTYPPQAIIVVDDGSSDDTAAIVSKFGERVKYHRQENQGQATARNVGTAIAATEWIAFLDSDDLWLPRKLELQVEALRKNPNADLCYCAYAFVEKWDDPLTCVVYPPPGSRAEMFRLCLSDCPTLPSTMLFRRQAFQDIGGFDPSLRLGEDWDLLARMAAEYDFTAVPDVLTLVARHAGNSTKQIYVRLDGDIKAIGKIFEMKEAREFQHLKAPKIAEIFYQTGLDLFYQNQLTSARGMFWKSLQNQSRNISAWAYLAKSFMPYGLFDLWRSVRYKSERA